MEEAMIGWSATSWSSGTGIPAIRGAFTVTGVLRAWGESVLSSDAATYRHCERTGIYAVAIARELGLPASEVETVQLGARLHDIGKVRIPAAILHKEGRLSPAEYAVVKMHPIWGLEMLDALDCPAAVRAIVRSHHEKRDGSGYPDRLRGDQIPLAAAIIGIADVYDALTTCRCYRPALPRRRALLEMQLRQGWWSPEVYAAFGRALGHPAGRRSRLEYRPRIRASGTLA
jgi:putative nucleotidyltransferase with HDIG domain